MARMVQVKGHNLWTRIIHCQWKWWSKYYLSHLTDWNHSYIIEKNHLLVNEKEDVGMAKLFSKKYGNKV